MKNVFDGPIKKLDISVKRISELEDMCIGTSKTEMPREKQF